MDYSIHCTTRIQKEEIEDLVSAQGGNVGGTFVLEYKEDKIENWSNFE